MRPARYVRGVRPGAFILTAAAVLAIAQGSASAATGSLYSGPEPRPGPDILYEPPVVAPQLLNRGIWRAKPILVSGASAYRKGEFLYQDYLYDDVGADGGISATGPRPATFSYSAGTVTYPTAPEYVENAADLVELRVRALKRSTAFRLTLNSMTDPDLIAATIAIGDSPSPQPWPFGANVSSPAERFLTVHGRSAELTDAAGGASSPAAVRVRGRLNQIEIRVPRSAWDPGSSQVRLAAGVGLWDRANGRYLVPQGGGPSATAPGGASGADASPAALFNVAFRFDEPWPDSSDVIGVFDEPKWWREWAQAKALAAGDVSGFSAVVDFAKLRSGATDPMHGQPQGVPTSGPMNRILSSRFSAGEGAKWEFACPSDAGCEGQMRGELQPYSIYVPKRPPPKRGYGMTLLLHSLDANYNQFSAHRHQEQVGERAAGSIVITPAGRGPDGWYADLAGADVFEVWADVAARYRLDPGWTSISGYSMGGYGTYKLAAQYPDLFARANPIVGPPSRGITIPGVVSGAETSDTNPMLASLRQIPFLIWVGAADELVPIAGTIDQANRFDALGLRYVFDIFTTSDHLLLAANDQYAPAAEFLGSARVPRNPAHITYVVKPALDFPERGTTADHAYWLSRLRLRDGSAAASIGKVDAISHGFGQGDPPVGATSSGAGAIPAGDLGLPFPYVEQSKAWGPAPSIPVRDRLELDLTNISRAVVHVERAKLSCHPELAVQTDGPATVKLAGCHRRLRFG